MLRRITNVFKQDKNYLWILMDSVGYDIFQKADAPNMSSVGTVQKVYSCASWTLPSLINLFILPSYFGYDGYLLPIHRQSPYWKPSVMQKRGYFCAFLTCNTYVHAYRDWFSKGFDFFKDYALEAKDKNQLATMVQQSLKFLRHTPYFIVLHIMEPHAPYYLGDQVKAIEYVDQTLEPLLNEVEKTVVVVMSDHGDIEGFHAPDKVDAFTPKLFEVPLIVAER